VIGDLHTHMSQTMVCLDNWSPLGLEVIKDELGFTHMTHKAADYSRCWDFMLMVYLGALDALIGAFCRSGDLKEFQEMAERMREDKLEYTSNDLDVLEIAFVEYFNAFVERAGKDNDNFKAWAVFIEVVRGSRLFLRGLHWADVDLMDMSIIFFHGIWVRSGKTNYSVLALNHLAGRFFRSPLRQRVYDLNRCLSYSGREGHNVAIDKVNEDCVMTWKQNAGELLCALSQKRCICQCAPPHPS
jgi:hypothetical protein